MTELHIRDALESDSAIILRFITELAEYEDASDEVVATVEGIQESLFAESASAHAVICLADDLPIGFAVYFYNYSTWQARNGLYLEDLYVSPEQRGSGAGKAILRHLAQLALRNDCGRFEWSVLVSNSPAIRFYDGIGAKPKTEWLGYRLAGGDLERFAHGEAPATR